MTEHSDNSNRPDAAEDARVDPPDSGDSEIDFPDVGQSFIDRDTLDQYLADLEACTDVVDVSVKGARMDHARDESYSLTDAASMLLAGDVLGIQVRYVWRNERWWDTLIRRDQGIQLTRIQPPSGS